MANPRVLASAESSRPARSAQDRAGVTKSDQADVASESRLGLTEDRRGASQARDRSREINGGEVQTAWGGIALCYLADISRNAHEGARRYRLLYRADGDILGAVRFPCAGT